MTSLEAVAYQLGSKQSAVQFTGSGKGGAVYRVVLVRGELNGSNFAALSALARRAKRCRWLGLEIIFYDINGNLQWPDNLTTYGRRKALHTSFASRFTLGVFDRNSGNLSSRCRKPARGTVDGTHLNAGPPFLSQGAAT